MAPYQGNVTPITHQLDLVEFFEFYDGVNGTGTKQFELVSAVQSVFENAGTYVERLIERRFFIGESIKNGSAIVKLKGSSAFEVKMKKNLVYLSMLLDHNHLKPFYQ